MPLMVRILLSVYVISCLSSALARGQSSRSVTASDCVQAHYPLKGSIKISPQGIRVAYLVKVPNLETNQNDVQLYVKDLRGAAAKSDRPLLTGVDLSEVTWLEDGMHIAILIRHDAHVAIAIVDIATANYEIAVTAESDIMEYTVDHDSNTIVFATEYPVSAPEIVPTVQEAASGYRIPFQRPNGSMEKKRTVFLLRHGADGHWGRPEQVTVHSPFSGAAIKELPYTVSLRSSLSPNGRYLLLTYLAEDKLPERWMRSLWVKKVLNYGGPVLITVLEDLKTGTTQFPFQTPWAYSLRPIWSPDSRSFLENASSPVESTWEQDDERRADIGVPHLFWVDLDSNVIQKVGSLSGLQLQPLSWDQSSELMIQTSANTVSWIMHKHGEWEQQEEIRIPLSGQLRSESISSDGKVIVGDYQAPTVPPKLFLYKIGQKEIQTIADLNPQFDSLTIASARDVHWKTSTGLSVNGLLFEPPSFVPGTKYPLVIQTQPNPGTFVCDSGDSHYPSFAPQPIANAGMFYLIRTVPETYRRQDDAPFYPTGYPGGLGEAALDTEIWDSAVDALAQTGLIDRNRVGIIGFSRTGWYTEFALVHGRTRYRAATLADNIQYSLSEYFAYHTDSYIRGSDAMYGGPPYGSTRKNWMANSISFNIERIQTPILMEVMGYGVSYSNQYAPPLGLAAYFEVFTGLNRSDKPVEMYYYPNEGHQPDHPQARLATLERNIDWYRFWLQEYERPKPEDPEQYVRWRHMRELKPPVEGSDRLPSLMSQPNWHSPMSR